MRTFALWFSGLALAIVTTVQAADQHPSNGGHSTSGAHVSPYAGQERRAIKTLSDQDIDDLLNGRGWGLAKAAELNGLPGPAHLLEMKDEIGLLPGQVREIEGLFAEMKEKAMALGKRFVALEHSLNQAFARRDIDEDRLKTFVTAIGKVRSDLRHVHLATHLRTPKILSDDQIKAYNRFRGYDLKGSESPHRHH